MNPETRRFTLVNRYLPLLIILALVLTGCIAERIERYASPETVEQSKLVALALVGSTSILSLAWVIVAFIKKGD